MTRLVDDAELELLRNEAFLLHQEAETVFVEVPGDEDGSHGDPERWLETAVGGPILQAFYHAPSTLNLLHQITGVSWTASGRQGGYSYYRAEGHHLGLHRDIDICDLAVITNINEEGAPAGDPAGSLCLYPSRSREHLSDIRETLDRGAVHLRLQSGQSLILLGGIVPHRLLPLRAGHVRIIAPLCYRIAE